MGSSQVGSESEAGENGMTRPFQRPAGPEGSEAPRMEIPAGILGGRVSDPGESDAYSTARSSPFLLRKSTIV
jgi:hypothetical protein